MVKTSHSRQLAFAGTMLLLGAHFASAKPVDPQILTFRQNLPTTAIEDIAPAAAQLAAQMGTNAIKMNSKNVKSLARFGADGIIAKASVPLTPNRPDNKADEIGELIAVIIDGLANNPKFLKTAKSKPLIKSAITEVLATAVATTELFNTTVLRDAAGSLALTIANKTALDPIQAKLQKFLSKSKTQKKIAGSLNQPAITAGINEGFVADTAANAKYETGTVNDPETDTKPA